MDRIEELLVEMCRAQGQATEYRVQGKNEEMRGAVGRRDHLWRRTAADWRAMVEALDNALWLLGTDEDRRNIGDLHLSSVYRIPGMLRTTLARVKGE